MIGEKGVVYKGIDGRKGILWVYNPSKKLDKAIKEEWSSFQSQSTRKE
jgi:hypothetical protein